MSLWGAAAVQAAGTGKQLQTLPVWADSSCVLSPPCMLTAHAHAVLPMTAMCWHLHANNMGVSCVANTVLSNSQADVQHSQLQAACALSQKQGPRCVLRHVGARQYFCVLWLMLAFAAVLMRC